MLLAIDPGVQAGWALFEDGTMFKVGVIAPSVGSWAERADKVMNLLSILAGQHEVSQIICEWPFYHETQGGREVAKSGALVKLSVMVGRICQMAADRQIPFSFVEVNTWKGQLPKTAVIHRIKRRLGETACTGIKTHAWDAVGIGLHHLGAF